MDIIDKIYMILERIIHISIYQYVRYFEKYRQLVQSRQLTDLVPTDILVQLRMDLENESLDYNSGRPDYEVERNLRNRIDNLHLEVFHRISRNHQTIDVRVRNQAAIFSRNRN